MKYKTVSYKGSKRKLLTDILSLAEEIGAVSAIDAFSGTGIVAAHLRQNGITVNANDLNPSSVLFASVFLVGYDEGTVKKYIEILNAITPKAGWLTQNYSGDVVRKVRGEKGLHSRPKAYSVENAKKIDAARDFVEALEIPAKDKNALIFSIILASDKVFNNSNDQKSSFKVWSKAALTDIIFEMPTLISGPIGNCIKGDVLNATFPKADFVYLDPPYTTGVLYGAAYHINDSIAIWDKPSLDHEYALARPDRAIFQGEGETTGAFYSKKTAEIDFSNLIKKFDAKRIVLSYSDAPRNSISIATLKKVAAKFGKVKVIKRNHKLCTQALSQKKISEELKEYFLIVDKA